MCGRVVATNSVSELVDWLNVDEVRAPYLPPSWNVAPGRELYVVAGSGDGARRLGLMRWGLVPSWSTETSLGPRPINARAESLLERPVFAEAVARRRCLVPVDGFYEWQRRASGVRQPFFINAAAEVSAGGSPLLLAGLWDRWVSPTGDSLVTVAIVTVPANEDMRPLHDRMPAIVVDDEARARWLDRSVTRPELVTPLLRPAATGFLQLRPVGRQVNSVANDGSELLDEYEEQEEPAQLF